MIEIQTQFYEQGDNCNGTSYGGWTIKWWQWAMSIPAKNNPLFDRNGLYSAEDQNSSVWFLAGKYADYDKSPSFPVRACTVPVGMPVLIPVLNCEADSIEYPELKTDKDIIDHVQHQVDSIQKKICYIDDELIVPQRVPSDPSMFDIYIHPDFDRLRNGGYSRAAADGYWVFLKPLGKGDYAIRFEGSCEYGRLNSGASYKLTVK